MTVKQREQITATGRSDARRTQYGGETWRNGTAQTCCAWRCSSLSS